MFDKISDFFRSLKFFSQQKAGDSVLPVANVWDSFGAPDQTVQGKESLSAVERVDKAIYYLLVLTAFGFPLFFAPFLANSFDLAKQAFLLGLVILMLLLWLGKLLFVKKITFRISIFDLPLFLFIAASAVAAWLSPNRFLGFLADPLLYFLCGLFYFLLTQSVRQEKVLAGVLRAVLISGAVLSLWSFTQVLLAPFLAKLPASAVYFSLNFSPTGSALTQGLFLAALLPLALGFYLKSKTRENKILAGVLGVGLAVSVMALLRTAPAILPLSTAWRIATGTLGESLTAALFGIGPGNFVDAFTQYKPSDFNATSFWNWRFTHSANYYLYLLTSIGVAGLVAFLWFVGRLGKFARQQLEAETMTVFDKGLTGSIGLILGLFLLFPGPNVLIFSLFLLTGCLVVHLGSLGHSAVRVREINNIPNVFLRGLVILAVSGLIILAARFPFNAVLADYYFAKSLAAAAANQATQVYNFQIQALNFNPYNDAYRVSYSQTNLALADAMASQPNLTDQQKQVVVQLVQQAIREGRLSTSLAPRRSSDWENLGNIYRNLINFANGADQWTLASFNQAVTLEPTNPQLRLALGGVYYSLSDWQSAAQAFNQAVNLKPDLANAHYNLAQALKKLNFNDQAGRELQLAASLVCAAGQKIDCDRVNEEIKELSDKLASVSAAPTATPLQEKIATASAEPRNLPRAKTTPPATIASPSGEINP